MNIEFLWQTLFSLSGYNHLVTFSGSWFLMVRPKWYLFSHTHTHTCTHIHFMCFILDRHLKFWNWHGKLKEGRTWNRWIFFFPANQNSAYFRQGVVSMVKRRRGREMKELEGGPHLLVLFKRCQSRRNSALVYSIF